VSAQTRLAGCASQLSGAYGEIADGPKGSPNRVLAIAVAAIAPANCATTNIGTSCGAIPANVFDRPRTTVIAGFAKLVNDVNQ